MSKKPDTNRVRKIKAKYGDNAYVSWGKSGGKKSGGSPVYQDKKVMALYYKRHPK